MYLLSASNLESVVDSTEQVLDIADNSGALKGIANQLDRLEELLSLTNALLGRLNDYCDYIVAFAVVILLCILFSRDLEYFTRF